MTFSALKIIIFDYLHYSPIIRFLMSGLYVLRSICLRIIRPSQIVLAIDSQCKAARISPNPAQQRRIETSIKKLIQRLDKQTILWDDVIPNANIKRLPRAILIKPYLGEKERGVIFISFEEEWMRLLALPNLAEFARMYTLVLAPSWSPPYCLENYLFPKYYPEPVFCLISNKKDLEFFPRISNHYQMIPLLASNWVNPDYIKPCSFEEKDIDIVLVANFGKYKRHHALFQALYHLPVNTKVVLVGQSWDGRSSKHLQAEAEAFRVGHRFELFENQSHEKVCKILARAKISLILSRREGSCVVVAESLFANTPVGMLANAEVGSLQFINDQTGRLLQSKNLAAQLIDFLAEANTYNPRNWALNHGKISCITSSLILNTLLKKNALDSGQVWTQDIATLHWKPDPQLLNDSDRKRFELSYDQIKNQFGLEIGNSSIPKNT